MFVRKCTLKNFRNHIDLNLDFNDKITVIYGSNGCGKTNVLEAIYVLSGIKSFRINSDENLVSFDKESYYISADVADDLSNKKFEIGYSLVNRKKKLKIDSIEIKSAISYFGFFLCVILCPGDILLIDGPLDLRRRYFDRIISTIDSEYLKTIHDMRKLLKIRNTLIKQKKNKEYFEQWDHLLSDKFFVITEKRKNFFSEYNSLFRKIYNEIGSNDEVPDIEYKTELAELDREKIYNRLSSGYERDIKFNATQFGSHRDMYNYRILKRNFNYIGSQGQKRSAALSLKIAEKEIIEEYLKKKAVILVDDIFSELDKIRRHNLISLLGKESQIIIAVTDFRDIPTSEIKHSLLDLSSGIQS